MIEQNTSLIREAHGVNRCPFCQGRRFTGVEYRGTSEDYDGVSEWLCELCGKRFGRWTGRLLIAGDIERRHGAGEGRPQPTRLDPATSRQRAREARAGRQQPTTDTSPMTYEEECAQPLAHEPERLLRSRPVGQPSSAPQPDPEPDLPQDECTTAAMLRKLVRLFKCGNLAFTPSASPQIVAAEWVAALEDRAERLERRASSAPSSSRTDLRKLLRRAVILAKEATNGWAIYAKREIEHSDIARLDKEIAKIESAPSAAESEHK